MRTGLRQVSRAYCMTEFFFEKNLIADFPDVVRVKTNIDSVQSLVGFEHLLLLWIPVIKAYPKLCLWLKYLFLNVNLFTTTEWWYTSWFPKFWFKLLQDHSTCREVLYLQQFTEPIAGQMAPWQCIGHTCTAFNYRQHTQVGIFCILWKFREEFPLLVHAESVLGTHLLHSPGLIFQGLTFVSTCENHIWFS